MKTKPFFFLSLTILLATSLANAQEIVTEFWHENGKYFNFHNIVGADDGTILVQCPVFESYPSGSNLGCAFYKITQTGELLDSLYIPSTNSPYVTLFEPLPKYVEALPKYAGKYLFARLDQGLTDSTTYLKMTLIDRYLNVMNDTAVAVENALSSLIIGSSDLFIDPYGDIIASYRFRDRIQMLRVGLDGVIKDRAAIDSIPFANVDLILRHSGPYGASQLRYCLWGYTEGSNYIGIPTIYVLDSLFNVVDSHQYNQIDNALWLTESLQHHLVPYDNAYNLYGSMAYGRFATQFGLQFLDITALVKFDNEFNIEKKYLTPVFDGYPQPTPIWTSVASPDTIYYSYMNDVGEANQIVIACLDADLNERWSRYCLEPDMFHWAICMSVLSDGRVAVGSFKHGENPGGISVVVVKDELWDVPENQAFIRPYTYYPNPVQDELRLHYSPDVTPTQIELYDMQGRLVKTQRNGLERLDMESLAPGIYTMRVTLEGGKVFSDKVVKE